LLSSLARNANAPRIFEQGNLLEYSIARHDAPYRDRLAAARRLIELLNIVDLTSDQLVSYFVSIQSVEEWLGKVRDLDVLIGFRFHGNIIGLFQGLPCFFYCYDSRLKEFCELYRLPYREVEYDYEDPVRIIADHDWSKTNDATRSCYKEMYDFFIENNIPQSLRMIAPY
jgi:polysaccharide pyruvyl transferase WcaK-like protein